MGGGYGINCIVWMDWRCWMERFALKSSRLVLEGGEQAAAVVVEGGKIVDVVGWGELGSGIAVQDWGDRVISPGVIDGHVHINEPGREEWEGFWTATRAAAAGGVTVLMDMPLNSIPPVLDGRSLELKLGSAEGKLWVDCGFYGGYVGQGLGHIWDLAGAGVW
ncbi:MAG: hypothetical protein D6805_06360, partial [Planctomycetota bacterium]